MAKHLCHAYACRYEIPRAHLMCRRHWAMVPAALKKQVRAGLSQSCAQWKTAADAARAAVDEIERNQFIDRSLKRASNAV